MAQRALEVELEAVGFRQVRVELKVVNAFIDHVLSCIDERIRDEVRHMAERYELGWNVKTGRLGVLFPEHLVDFRAYPGRSPSEDSGDHS